MKRTLYYIVLFAVIQSCSSYRNQDVSISCEDEFPLLFSVSAPGTGLFITGKVRIELPRYRVRGVANMRYAPTGRLRIDFHHSSLFGAVREDASIFINDGSISIFDHERGRFFGHDSSLALIGSNFVFDIYHDDLLSALLLESPSCREFGSIDFSGRDDEWSLEGTWRDRWVAISGERGRGPLEFRLCREAGSGCYIIWYFYSDRAGSIRYPKRIVLVKEHGAERVSVDIVEVREEFIAPGTFDLGRLPPSEEFQ